MNKGFAIIGLAGLTLLSPVTWSQPINGLIAHYTLDGHANDVSGNGWNATSSGPIATNDRNGEANGALYFDGTNDYVVLPNMFPSPNAYSVSLWFKPEGENSTETYDGQILFDLRGQYQSWIWLYEDDDVSQPNSVEFAIYNGTTTYVSTGSGSITQSAWNHLVATFSGSEMKIYLDGELKDNQAKTPPSGSSSTSKLGKDYHSVNRLWFKGAMDEVLVYDRELTAQEVTELYGGEEPLWTVTASGIYYDSGAVGIGTDTIPAGYTLAVDGPAIMEEVTVDNYSVWPDYVFDPSYELLPLPELHALVRRQKHLPGIPSAREIEQNGVQVGRMQGLLLEKVEELTLYLLQQHRQVDSLYRRLQVLEQDQALNSRITEGR